MAAYSADPRRPHAESVEELRAQAVARLRCRRAELEAATLTRVYAISDPTEADPAYLEGLRASVSVALDYALQAIECGEQHPPPLPPVLRAQARMAARSGIALDTVLRRYFAGYVLLGDFLAGEAARGGLPGDATPTQLLRDQAPLFDRLLAAVSEEYARESSSRLRSSEQRRAEHVERLLAGELFDTSGLTYNFEAHHTGLIATGGGAPGAIRELATTLDRRLLLVRRDEETVWAWLGGRRRLESADVRRCLISTDHIRVTFALGEPAPGLAGWRLTHRQAAAVLPIALRRGEPVIRYVEVALVASVLRDELLVASLRQLYLVPLDAGRDGGKTARETLRAYFAADRNVSSAAAALGVNRNTVASRLSAIEMVIGRSIASAAAELEVALRLE